jgi:hypothetical protein
MDNGKWSLCVREHLLKGCPTGHIRLNSVPPNISKLNDGEFVVTRKAISNQLDSFTYDLGSNQSHNRMRRRDRLVQPHG